MSDFNNFQNVLSDGTEVVALGVTSEQNDIVKKIVEGDFSRMYGNYTLEEADSDMAQEYRVLADQVAAISGLEYPSC